MVSDSSFNDETHKTVSFSLGSIYPNAIGNSYIAENSTQDFGVDFVARFHLVEKLTLGVNINFFGLDIEDQNALYDRSRVSSLGLDVGYVVLRQKTFNILAVGSVGAVNYRNSKGGEKFNDTGTYFALGAEFEYVISTYFQLYAGPEFRMDRLNIDAPASIDTEVNKIDYLNIHFGVRLTLWNNEASTEKEEIEDTPKESE